jgi:hypothetical protein
MRGSRLVVILFFLTVISFLTVQAQQPTTPADPSKTEPTATQAATSADESAVDAAKVTGSTFESQYFKFSYELPKGWKALDDAARVAANQMLSRADRDRGAERGTTNKKSAMRPSEKTTPGLARSTVNSPESYSLMVASPNGVESLQSPVLPRVNFWANKKVPPLDSPADHVQFLYAGKRTRALVRPQEVTFDGHAFARASVITPTGEFHSQYVTVIGEYLVGFDFRAQSERELVEMTETMKTIKFQ